MTWLFIIILIVSCVFIEIIAGGVKKNKEDRFIDAVIFAKTMEAENPGLCQNCVLNLGMLGLGYLQSKACKDETCPVFNSPGNKVKQYKEEINGAAGNK